jgi:two-component system sensor histidine kinase UhpB
LDAPAEFDDSEGNAPPHLKVAIEDNGIGLSEGIAPGMGLLGINERVRALGGAQRIERPQSGGTRIIVSLPLRDDGE